MIFRRKKKSAAAGASRALLKTTATSSRKAVQPRRKILVADDDPVTVRALLTKLQSRGFDVVTAADGSQAITVTRREKPDLMLLDVNFPPDVSYGGSVAWDGFNLAQWFRRNEEDYHIPVIVISASNSPEYKRRAEAVGAAAFLPKTVDGDGLVGCISLALAKKCGSEPVPIA